MVKATKTRPTVHKTENNTKMTNNQTGSKKRKNYTIDNSFSESALKRLKSDFVSSDFNKVVQNSLCSNYLESVSEARDYMQSRDKHFSHTLEPKLRVTNQGLSGRCWMFAVLNVLRHELIRDLQLPFDFEFSESYLGFYEKIEKCNHFLTQFMELDSIDTENDDHTRAVLCHGLSEGGFWQTCSNLIKKYGLMPKSCFLESVNSYRTDDVDEIMSTKLREYALTLVKTEHSERLQLKEKMMEEIYGILSKMLGTPPCPDEEFEWSYVPRLDMTELLEMDQERKETGEYKTLEIKKLLKLTPLQFYNNFVARKMEDYLSFSNDPRNPYGVYYESHWEESMVGGEKVGYYNMEMEFIEKMCIASILNNTPVMFCCDVNHYLNYDEELFDTKCFNYNLLFGTSFDKLSKEEMMNVRESAANHAMVLVGVDLDSKGNPLKWKVENSWGRTRHTVNEEDEGYFTMSHDWFKKYVYDVIIHRDFLPRQMIVEYNNAKKNKVILPEHDVMANPLL